MSIYKDCVNFGVMIWGDYCMRLDYFDEPDNVLVITSENRATGESFENLIKGDLDGVVKFNASNIYDYIRMAQGRLIPAIHDKIGFIYSVEDLNIRRGLLTDDEYNAIRSRYPYLPEYCCHLRQDNKYLARVVYQSGVAVCCGKTGKPISSEPPVIDFSKEAWYNIIDVPIVDLRSVCPEMADVIVDRSPTDMRFFDPIEADIWRKYGSNFKKPE